MRTVVLAPLAAPAASGGTSERMTLLSCEPAKPMPMPNERRSRAAAPRTTASVVIDDRATTPRPSASMNSPARTTLVVPMRRVSQLPSLRADDDGDAGRHEPEAGVDRREVTAVLQQDRHDQQERDLAHRHEQQRDEP